MLTMLGLVLGFALATAGTALECEVCSGMGTNCNGTMQTCEAGQDTCIIAVSESSMMGTQTQMVFKACESSAVCQHGPQYVHYGYGQDSRARFACCVGEACRTATPQLPPVISKPNGKQCPACISVISGTCNPDETVDCVGPETECLDSEATMSYGVVVLKVLQKGCVTKGMCSDPKIGEIKMAGIQAVFTKVECKAATPIA